MLLAPLLRIAAVILALVTPVAAADVVLTGEVTYRERMALPAGAQLRIILVTLPDARPVVGAGASIAARGQVPIAFTLNVRSSVVDQGGAYGLLAEIHAEGRTLFRSFEPTPVAIDAPEPVTVLVQFAPAPPHDPPEPAPTPVETPPLLDTAWRVTSVGGRPVLAGTELTLTIAPDHAVGGQGGCNSYFAEATFADTTLAFGAVAATLRACADDIMAQEAAFFAALEATAGYQLMDDGLQLRDPAGVPLVGLIRIP